MEQDVAQMVERLLSILGGKGIDKHSISIVFHNFIYALIGLLAGPLYLNPNSRLFLLFPQYFSFQID